ncbi:MAG: hypothetical protein MHMPM18_004940, partial [Marteilia pararefringens]
NVCEHDLIKDLQASISILDEIVSGGQIHEVRPRDVSEIALALDSYDNSKFMNNLKSFFFSPDL